MEDVRTLATGLDHPEGIALGPDSLLYAGGEAGQVYRVDPTNGGTQQIAASEGGYMLGLCLDAAGAVYICDAGIAAVLRVDPSGALERWCEAADGTRLTCPNWPAFGLGPRGSTRGGWAHHPCPARRRRCDGTRASAVVLPKRARTRRGRDARLPRELQTSPAPSPRLGPAGHRGAARHGAGRRCSRRRRRLRRELLLPLPPLPCAAWWRGA